MPGSGRWGARSRFPILFNLSDEMVPARSFAVVLLAVLGCAGAGCASVAVPEEPTVPNPARPVWEPPALLEHLRFFNQNDLSDRATGTVGFAGTAAYVAARMREFRLQPVLGSSFRVLYQTPLNYPLGGVLSMSGAADTLSFWMGVDVLPDGRSDSGAVAATRLARVSPEEAPGEAGGDPLPGAPVVMIEATRATTPYLEALARQGVQAVLAVGALRPNPAPAPVDGLVVMQIVPEAAAQIVNRSPAFLEAWLAGVGPPVLALRATLQMHVVADHQPLAGAMNLIGLQPGKHPRLASDLVLVCADLDALGRFGGVGVFDVRHMGAGAAAVLEVARLYSAFARYWPLPERTIMFAFWSGARVGHAGLKAYLRNPPWLLERTRAVIYAGLAPEEEPAVRALLAAHGLPLYVVPDPLHEEDLPPFLLQPPPEVPRRARAAARPAPAVSGRMLVQRAVAAAQAMADSVNVLLLREAIRPGGVVPVSPDRLRIPAEAPPDEGPSR
ncbi:hypothetical protein AWN76_007370 [Rhodothermaceae bacterium RA]|nr:hypothetical protein AWN76_007370 [Rhodothermaceae bacterium RA]